MRGNFAGRCFRAGHCSFVAHSAAILKVGALALPPLAGIALRWDLTAMPWDAPEQLVGIAQVLVGSAAVDADADAALRAAHLAAVRPGPAHRFLHTPSLPHRSAAHPR